MCTRLRREKCIKREQHYLNLLKPEYNILNTAGSLLGFKHSNETKAKISAYLKTLYANLKFKAKRLEQLKRLHSNPEQQAKRLEHSYASKVKRVSVLDTKKNETTIYPSISEASQAIGCTKSTISIALKYQQDKAVLRLVKKKYVISHLKEADSSVVSGLAPQAIMCAIGGKSNKQLVEVVDTLNGNTTVYPSINQAAQAIGCVHAAICKVLKNFQETGESRLIKKRFLVKRS